MGLDFTGFIDYVERYIKGYEKGEAQIFLDHFFQTLGYPEGLKGAGANCEFRVLDEKGTTKFADLVWKPIVLIEMKKRGADLTNHYQQAFDYWTKLVPNRPQYIILCNFDEFWIYDLNIQVYEPLEKIHFSKLHERQEAFGFMLPKPRTPIFNYNKEDVTKKAAYYISDVYRSLTGRGIQPEIALKYCLQIVLTLFAEDTELLPDHIFTRIIKALLLEPGGGPDKVIKSYDLISGLFNAMNSKGITQGGMFKGVDCFNGGLFDKIYPIELTKHEITMVDMAASFTWSNVNPAIFGSIFESALDDKERHKLGAHYTHELDIKKIVVPVIVAPWLEKIDGAVTLDNYFELLTELSQFRVLDPACGSGNFLFIAFKEMKFIEKRLLSEMREKFRKPADAKRIVPFLIKFKYVTTNQFYGIDIKPFAVELAKVTMMIAKELIWLGSREDHDNKYKPLPLDNLDLNVVCEDALLSTDGTQRLWPEADAIIGNPPYQSKNKMQQEFGVEYLYRLRQAYPEIPGRADFCVYWFYKAHQHLKPNHFAGLVGTNTIRQNYSREGSLDYIVKNGGTIVNAVSSEQWLGEAAVFISIVSWVKGNFAKEKILYYENNGQLYSYYMPVINSSLSLKTDVTGAKGLKCNKLPKKVFQGQTHGHEGFLLPKVKALTILKEHPEYKAVLKPFMNGQEFVAKLHSQPERFVIDFTNLDLNQASSFKELLKKIEKEVLPDREKKSNDQTLANEKSHLANKGSKGNKHHLNFYNKWWQLSYGREDMLNQISKIKKYISIPEYSKRPIFDFISAEINPNAKLMVFAFEDNYSFGIIQSNLHWMWITEKGATLGQDTYSYTTNTIWDTFPWPQNPSKQQIESIAKASKTLRDERNKIMNENKLSLRDLYRNLEKPGKNILKDLQKNLDQAVLEAYGFDVSLDLLSQLLQLNELVAKREVNGEKVQCPGLPDWFEGKESLVSDDCVKFLG